MVAAGTLRVVRAEGNAADRGRLVGRELGDLVHRSLDFYRGVLERYGAGSRTLSRTLAPYRAAAERHLSAHLVRLDALADAAEVSRDELFAVNALEELEPRAERCSSFVVSSDGAALLGHNEMELAGDAGNIAIVIEHPSDGVAIASPTVVCCLPAVGMNAFGTAQGIDSLTAPSDRVGVPRVLVSRHSLEARDAVDARGRAALPGRAGGYAHLFAFRGGATAVVETTADRDAVLPEPGVHTNHYLDPELALAGDPPWPGTLERHERLTELLEEHRPRTPDTAMEVLRREAAAHGDIGEGDESYAVVFSLVCDVEAGRMWVAPGDPATTPYEEIDLDGVIP
jgi:hypothetical protein